MQRPKRVQDHLNHLRASKAGQESAWELNDRMTRLLNEEEGRHNQRMERLLQLQLQCDQIQAKLDELKAGRK